MTSACILGPILGFAWKKYFKNCKFLPKFILIFECFNNLRTASNYQIWKLETQEKCFYTPSIILGHIDQNLWGLEKKLFFFFFLKKIFFFKKIFFWEKILGPPVEPREPPTPSKTLARPFLENTGIVNSDLSSPNNI